MTKFFLTIVILTCIYVYYSYYTAGQQVLALVGADY